MTRRGVKIDQTEVKRSPIQMIYVEASKNTLSKGMNHNPHSDNGCGEVKEFFSALSDVVLDGNTAFLSKLWEFFEIEDAR